MRYSFNDFVFDSEQLLLSKQNEMIPCRPNEAKLLALFLAEPQRVLSKDDILDRVWAGKVVSEQAVFQSISNLRNVFGESAIKTFPKKGYQWQPSVSLLEPAGSVVAPNAETAGSFDLRHTRSRWLLLLVAVIVSLVILFYMLNKYKSERAPIAILPLIVDSQNQNSSELQVELLDAFWKSLLGTGMFQAVVLKQDENHRDFFYAPQKFFKSIALRTNSSLVMAASLGKRNDKVFIRFFLQSQGNTWIAEIEEDTREQLLKTWLDHLSHVVQSRFATADAMDVVLMNAELKLLNNKYPDDRVILCRLVQSQLALGDSSNALVLAEQLHDKAQSHHDKFNMAYALLLWGQALQQQELLNGAEKKYQESLNIFRAGQNHRSASEVQIALGSVAFALGNYEQMKARQLQAIESAHLAVDVLLEAHINEMSAVMALKFGLHNETEYFLKQAEALLDQHNQSREHYAMVYFYKGMSEPDPARAEYQYRRVISVTPDDPTLWVRERAQANLIQFLSIKNDGRMRLMFTQVSIL